MVLEYSEETRLVADTKVLLERLSMGVSFNMSYYVIS